MKRQYDGVWLGTCATCGKRSYITKDDAKAARRQVKNQGRMAVYRCGNAWHLGHLPRGVVRGDYSRGAL